MILRQHVEGDVREPGKATGPTSEEGKAVSRRNPLTHGLAGKGVVMLEDDEKLYLQRKFSFTEILSPENPYRVWLASELAKATVRIDRAWIEEESARQTSASRAVDCWDIDRSIDAANLGEKIHRKPEKIALQLEKSLHGCRWKLRRWQDLLARAQSKTPWTGSHESEALDLLGFRLEYRDLPTPLSCTEPDASEQERSALRLAVINQQIARLAERVEGALVVLDQEEQAQAASGAGSFRDADVKRARRYLTTHTRHLAQIIQQLTVHEKSLKEVELFDELAGTPDFRTCPITNFTRAYLERKRSEAQENSDSLLEHSPSPSDQADAHVHGDMSPENHAPAQPATLVANPLKKEPSVDLVPPAYFPSEPMKAAIEQVKEEVKAEDDRIFDRECGALISWDEQQKQMQKQKERERATVSKQAAPTLNRKQRRELVKQAKAERRRRERGF